MRKHSSSRRLAALLLVVVSLLALAPRTSEVLDNGWHVAPVSDTFGRSAVSTFTFWAMPPQNVPAESRIPLYITGDDWQLVRAPAGCTATSDAVVCLLSKDTIRRKHLITIVVRSAGGPLSHAFAPPGT